MSLNGIALNQLNHNVDFKKIEHRYMHKLLPGNFAILPTLSGTFIFALLGKADGIKKIMLQQDLFALHYIDYEDAVPLFDSLIFAENNAEWMQEKVRSFGFKTVRQFISWRR